MTAVYRRPSQGLITHTSPILEGSVYMWRSCDASFLTFWENAKCVREIGSD